MQFSSRQERGAGKRKRNVFSLGERSRGEIYEKTKEEF
jgi:hypothetical protein